MSRKKQIQEVEVDEIQSPRRAAVEIEDLTVLTPNLVTVPAIRTAITGKLGMSGAIDRVKQYAKTSVQFARASLAMQVMAGMELSTIKDASPYQRGGRRAKSNPQTEGRSNPHGAGLIENTYETAETAAFARHRTWEEFVILELGLSADTAGRWMAMAAAARARLCRIDGFGALIRDLLERPICDLDDAEVDVLAKSVAKITDGRTQLDFMVEMGMVKRPGNPALGGANGGLKPGGVIGDEEIRVAAMADWESAQRALSGGGMSFTVLDDALIEAEVDYLARALRVRREWLATPSAKRTPSLIEALGKAIL